MSVLINARAECLGKASEKVEFKRRSTWAVGKRILQAEGIVRKSMEHWKTWKAGHVAGEQRVGERRERKGVEEEKSRRTCKTLQISEGFYSLFEG